MLYFIVAESTCVAASVLVIQVLLVANPTWTYYKAFGA